MQRTNKTIITEKDANVRLDVFLANRFNYLSRNQWQEEIENGSISVNSNSAKTYYELKIGDEISYLKKNVVEPKVDLSYKITLQDKNFLVIDKPGNLPIHPSGKFFNHTLWALLKKDFTNFHFINRLDRETSGLLLVALNPETAKIFNLQMQNGQIEKEYEILVHGEMPEIAAIGFIGNDVESVIRKKRAFFLQKTISEPQSDWETSSTFFFVKNYFPEKNISLMRVILGTGRLHQIRATSFSLGFPVVGDKIYGLDENFYLNFIDEKLTPNDHKNLMLERQALHASRLTFFHPISQEKITVNSTSNFT